MLMIGKDLKVFAPTFVYAFVLVVKRNHLTNIHNFKIFNENN